MDTRLSPVVDLIQSPVAVLETILRSIHRCRQTATPLPDFGRAVQIGHWIGCQHALPAAIAQVGQAGIHVMGNSILDEVREAFRRVARPEQFHDPSHCEECAEHETTLQAHTPETIGVEQLGNPGWDPICGISEEGYHYYLPGLARLALNEPAYLDQFLFHLSPDRTSRFTPDQRVAILHLLEDIRRRLVNELGDQAEVDVIERRLRLLKA